MRPTFLAFQTAHRAMAASQANIDVTGNNIANVNTDGYSRQRVDLNSIASNNSNQRYVVTGASVGYGVEATQISQIRDPFLDARYRSEAAVSGRFDTIAAGLADLERVLDEVDTPGLQNELSNFINQLQTLSQTPTSTDLSLIVRTAAHKVTQILNVYSNQINQVRSQQVFDLNDVIVNNEFNSLVKNIASLNTQIREELTHGATPNELYDKRNLLIDQLSGIANIKVTTKPEKISENLTIENLSISIYNANMGSIDIVDNGLYNTLSVKQNNGSSGPLSIEINSSFNAPADSDITAFFSDGSIKGYLDLINGKGTYADATVASENDFRGTLYYQNAIDTFAKNFAYTLNELNNETDSSGNVITKPLFEAADGVSAITAGNITISRDWTNDPGFITTTTNTVPPGTTAGEADNILRMISALESDLSFVRNPFGTAPGDNAEFFSGSFAEYMSGLTGELSLDIDLNNNFAETSQSVLVNLYNSRESISGVSLDEEGINLMAFQKSYNAAARYFTVLDEAVDTIINKMGIVGR